jgi:AcrR family transcriptional regulator
VDDIARQAGVSRTTFYLHFRDRTQIVGELFDHATRDFGCFITELNELGDPTWAQVREWLGSVESYRRGHEEMFSTLCQVVVAEPGLAAAWWTAARRTAHGISETLLGDDPAGQNAAMVRAMLFMMAFERMYYLRGVIDTGLDADALLDALADLWWAVLHPRRE